MATYTPQLSGNGDLFIKHTAKPLQLTWALGAAFSIVSSRYLLVDLGFHYPFCLHLLQVLATILLQAILLTWLNVEACSVVLPNSSVNQGILRAALPLSSALMLQAALHFPNLTTLTMLSVRQLDIYKHTVTQLT
jgi:hypothetical protein